jgi:hypothetical protein
MTPDREPTDGHITCRLSGEGGHLRRREGQGRGERDDVSLLGQIPKIQPEHHGPIHYACLAFKFVRNGHKNPHFEIMQLTVYEGGGVSGACEEQPLLRYFYLFRIKWTGCVLGSRRKCGVVLPQPVEVINPETSSETAYPLAL